MFNALLLINRYLVKIEKTMIVLLLATLITLAFGQIIARDLFSSGAMWVDRTIRICVLWIVFIGASLAMEKRSHIRIDILQGLGITAALKKKAHITAQLAAMVLCAILFGAAAAYMPNAVLNTAAPLFGIIPEWTLRLIIPYAFFVMLLRCPLSLLNPHTHERVG